MTEGLYSSVHFFHLKKTGGTALNEWLDRMFADPDKDGPERSLVAQVLAGDYISPDDPNIESVYAKACASLPFGMDSLHTHMPMPTRARPGAFTFTVLREPRARILSELADWRRLTDRDLSHIAEPGRSMMAAASRMSVREFLEEHGTGHLRSLLDNYQVRAMAATRLGFSALDEKNLDALFEVAAEAMVRDFDYVGTSDRTEATGRVVARALGFPPPSRVFEANVTSGGRGDLAEVPEHLVRYDERLWQFAQALSARVETAYDRSAFERGHGCRLASRLTARIDGSSLYYSVRQPIFGDGLHRRDSPGRPECAVWTSSRGSLYVPAPKGRLIRALVWARGYASQEVRDTLVLDTSTSDGEGRWLRPEFERGYRCEDVIVSEPFCVPSDFFRLDLRSDAACDGGHADPRVRGVCFDRYGWRMA
jgi:hypothetical protein